jgi:chromosome segregation ATPase
MDIITGLAAAAQALDITKKLRDLSADLDTATYRAQIAELYSNLADVKMALSDAREAIHDRDQRIRKLEGELDASRSGDVCPRCRTGRMKVTASHAHPIFGDVGLKERVLTCQNPECGHIEKIMVDGNGKVVAG